MMTGADDQMIEGLDALAVERLGVRALRIGPTIDPGVPWTFSLDKDPLALALKSGNFGAPDFFTSAFNKLPN